MLSSEQKAQLDSYVRAVVLNPITLDQSGDGWTLAVHTSAKSIKEAKEEISGLTLTSCTLKEGVLSAVVKYPDAWTQDALMLAGFNTITGLDGTWELSTPPVSIEETEEQPAPLPDETAHIVKESSSPHTLQTLIDDLKAQLSATQQERDAAIMAKAEATRQCQLAEQSRDAARKQILDEKHLTDKIAALDAENKQLKAQVAAQKELIPALDDDGMVMIYAWGISSAELNHTFQAGYQMLFLQMDATTQKVNCIYRRPKNMGDTSNGTHAAAHAEPINIVPVEPSQPSADVIPDLEFYRTQSNSVITNALLSQRITPDQAQMIFNQRVLDRMQAVR